MKNLDLNNLVTKVLKVHWAPFWLVRCHFIFKKKQEKCWISFTRACKSMARSDSTRKKFRWLWLDRYD